MPAAHEHVIRYIDVIESVRRGSGMRANEEPKRFVVGDETARAASIWYASAIVHDAAHSELYSQGKPWRGAEPERYCLEAQRVALVAMAAPPEMMSHFEDRATQDYYSHPYADRAW